MIHKLYKEYRNDVEFVFLPGGLWIDEHKKLVTPQVAINLTKASKKVEKISGRVFGEGFYKLLETGHEFDSLIGSTAFVAASEMSIDDPFVFLEKMYEFTFMEGINTNDKAMYLNAAKKVGLDVTMFGKLFASEEIEKETRDQIGKARELGVKSYPTVLLQNEKGIFNYDINYSDYNALREWLLNQVSDIDG
jgi:putative protein-disulfide isomerase